VFIELTEILRCPRDHPESYLVAAPIAMDGRRIVRGVVGCPECKAEFPIVDGVTYFGGGAGGAAPERAGAPGPGAATAAGAAVEPTGAPRRPPPEYDVTALAAFLHLDGSGGYAALVGRAARFGPALVALLPGVHVVAVNPPPGLAPLPMLSILESPGALPFKTATLRAAALGADHAAAPWPQDAARVLLPGLRLVIEDENARPGGVTELARGAGLFVGTRDR
jgi:uncharacterized protein YbaR (Trm112 family)